MAIRKIDFGRVYEITHHFHKLAPVVEAGMARELVGILAKAAAVYGVQIFAYAFMSNHYHMLCRFSDQLQQANFLERIHNRISCLVRKSAPWAGPVWQTRASVDPVSAEPLAQAKRLRYILSNSYKENALNAGGELWHLPHAAKYFRSGEFEQGVWTESRHGLAKGKTGDEECLALPVATLPAFAHLQAPEYLARVCTLIDSIQREPEERSAGLSGFLAGCDDLPLESQGLSTKDPLVETPEIHMGTLQKAKVPKRVFGMFFHFEDVVLRAAAIAHYRAHLEAQAVARPRHMEGRRGPKFPPGGFAPPRLTLALAKSRQKSAISRQPRPASRI